MDTTAKTTAGVTAHEADDAAMRWIGAAADLCEAAARGDLEGRLQGCREGGEVGRMVDAVNLLLDVTDAFVREAGASLIAAAEGRFHRRVIERGLLGSFRRGATLINTANGRMEQNARALQDAAERRRALAADFDGAISRAIAVVASSATEMQASASTLAETASATTRTAGSVEVETQRMSQNVQTVASATEELAASAREVQRQVASATTIATTAADATEQATGTVRALTDASSQIGQVVKLITSIASQTNLLALNATIEAARAGTAGKGFAVVAAEVKHLAQQTAAATGDIRSQVEAIQRGTQGAVAAIGRIGGTIDDVNRILQAIATSATEQQAATSEISQTTSRVAGGTDALSHDAATVTRAAHDTSEATSQMNAAAGALAAEAEGLRAAADRFLGLLRDGAGTPA